MSRSGFGDSVAPAGSELVAVAFGSTSIAPLLSAQEPMLTKLSTVGAIVIVGLIAVLPQPTLGVDAWLRRGTVPSEVAGCVRFARTADQRSLSREAALEATRECGIIIPRQGRRCPYVGRGSSDEVWRPPVALPNRVRTTCPGSGSGWRVRPPWPAAPEVHHANQAEHEGAEHVPRVEGHRSRHAREGEEDPRPPRRRSSPRQEAEPDEPQGQEGVSAKVAGILVPKN